MMSGRGMLSLVGVAAVAIVAAYVNPKYETYDEYRKAQWEQVQESDRLRQEGEREMAAYRAQLERERAAARAARGPVEITIVPTGVDGPRPVVGSLGSTRYGFTFERGGGFACAIGGGGLEQTIAATMRLRHAQEHQIPVRFTAKPNDHSGCYNLLTHPVQAQLETTD